MYICAARTENLKRMDIAIYTITSGLHDAKSVAGLTDEFLREIFPDGGFEFKGADSHPVALAYTTHDKADMNMCWDAIAALAYVTGFSDVTMSGPYNAAINSNGIMELTGNPYGNFQVIGLSPEQQLRNKELLLNILGTRID